MRTDGTVLWSFAQAGTVPFDGGSCFLGNGALLKYRNVLIGGLGLRILGLSLAGPMLDWPHDFHGFKVGQMAGPIVDHQKSLAWLVASDQNNDDALLHVVACDRSTGVVDSAPILALHTVHSLHAAFLPGHGPLVAPMLQHPDAFSAVPWEAMFDTSDLVMLWSTYLTDTSGFLMNAPAIRGGFDAVRGYGLFIGPMQAELLGEGFARRNQGKPAMRKRMEQRCTERGVISLSVVTREPMHLRKRSRYRKSSRPITPSTLEIARSAYQWWE
ncbi:MAG: hypothetical protein JST38_02925 [Bacteroidetes bacterium]|nr:hypothetical protein [Bacteroidota bacterium]